MFQNCSPKNSEHYTTHEPSHLQVRSALKAKVSQFMTTNCIHCHSSNNPNKITDILDEKQLIENEYIVPGKPQDSLIYIYLVDEIEPRDNLEAVSQTDIELMRDWILSFEEQVDSDIIQ